MEKFWSSLGCHKVKNINRDRLYKDIRAERT